MLYLMLHSFEGQMNAIYVWRVFALEKEMEREREREREMIEGVRSMCALS